MAKKDPRKRVIKASKDAEAGITLSNKAAQIIGNANNFISVTENGIFLKGKVSFITDGTGVRRGGLFVEMPDMTKMIPSTIISPLPSHLPIPPIVGLVNIAKDVAFFMSLLV